METKAQIRTFFRQKRDALSIQERKKYNTQICHHIMDSKFFKQADTIYLFYPLASEVSLLEIFEAAQSLGKTIAFPKVHGKEMMFYKIQNLSQLAEGCFHVMEPDLTQIDANSCKITEKEPVILIPGLVFDRLGNRYGYGKGFYDKYLKQYPNACKIGVAYDIQITNKIKADAYDIPIEHLFTQSGLLY